MARRDMSQHSQNEENENIHSERFFDGVEVVVPLLVIAGIVVASKLFPVIGMVFGALATFFISSYIAGFIRKEGIHKLKRRLRDNE